MSNDTGLDTHIPIPTPFNSPHEGLSDILKDKRMKEK